MQTDDLLPSNGGPNGADRMFISGRSGTGKSTFAYDMLHACVDRGDRLIAIDSKRDKKFPRAGFTICTRASEVMWAMRFNRWPILWRVSPSEFDDPSVYEPILHHLFKIGKVTIYIDESMTFTTSNPPRPRAMTLLYAQGRGRDVCMITGAQRPALIPRCVISESNIFAIFSLNERDDQRRIQEKIYYDPGALARYEFWYGNTDTDESIKCKLADR